MQDLRLVVHGVTKNPEPNVVTPVRHHHHHRPHLHHHHHHHHRPQKKTMTVTAVVTAAVTTVEIKIHRHRLLLRHHLLLLRPRHLHRLKKMTLTNVTMSLKNQNISRVVDVAAISSKFIMTSTMLLQRFFNYSPGVR